MNFKKYFTEQDKNINTVVTEESLEDRINIALVLINR
jgi:hypothetical protein